MASRSERHAVRRRKIKELRALARDATAPLGGLTVDVSRCAFKGRHIGEHLMPLLVSRHCNDARQIGVFTYTPDNDNQLCLVPGEVRRNFASLGDGAHPVHTLDVSGNPLNNSGLVTLAQLLRVNTSVRWLRVRDVGATAEGMTQFARAVCGNAYMCRVDVGERPLCGDTGDIVPGVSLSARHRRQSDTTATNFIDVADAETRALLAHLLRENAALLRQGERAFVVTGRAACEPFGVCAARVPATVRRIDLSRNALHALPDALFVRTAHCLVDLNIDANALTALPPALLTRCHALRTLSAAGNRLTALPDEFAGLEGRLMSLNVARNRLTALPPSLFQLLSLRELVVARNPLRSVPPALVAAGNAEFINYMRIARNGADQQQRQQQRGKLLLVGERGAGKTTLLGAIAGRAVDAAAAVHVSTFEIAAAVRFVAWDYAGGALRCVRHMFIAASRGRDAIFVVVVRCATLRHLAPAQALAHVAQQVRTLCGYDGAEPGTDNPIVVVFTGADELDADGAVQLQQQTLPAVLAELQRQFPNVVGAHLCSLGARAPPSGVAELRETLREIACAQSANRHAGVPAWFASMAQYVPQYVRAHRLQPVTTFDALFDALRSAALGTVPRNVTRADLMALLTYLNDIGVALNCAALDTHPVVLAPEWLAAALARLYADADVRDCGGIQTVARIDGALRRCTDGGACAEQVRVLARSMSMLIALSPGSSRAVLPSTSDVTGAYLLPELLHPDVQRRAPFFESTLFGAAAESGQERMVHRAFVFREPPVALMEHVIARLVARDSDYVLVSAWRTGVVVYWREDGAPGGTVMVTMPDPQRLVARVVAHRAHGHIAQALRLFRALTTMISEWMQLECRVQCACPHTDAHYLRQLRTGTGSACQPHYIDLEDIAAARAAGSTDVRCPVCRAAAPLAAMVPDMSIANVRHFIDTRAAAPGTGARSDLIVFDDVTELDITGRLGAGAFGVVHRAVVHGDVVAVKTLLLPEGGSGGEKAASTHALDEMLAELSAMIFMPAHPNLVALRGVVKHPPGVIIEYANMGSLFDYIHGTDAAATARSSLDDAETTVRLGIALGVARGMAAMHGSRMVHRDLKSPNVLLHRDTAQTIVAKVADFGLSVSMHMTERLSAARVENPMWLAPEVLQGAPGTVARMAYTERSDVYSFGVILYELFYERMPYESCFDSEIERLVRAGALPVLDRTAMPDLNTLIARCWSRAAADRPPFVYVCRELSALLARHARASMRSQ